MSFTSIPTDELAVVCGGGAAWDAYVKKQRAAVEPQYKTVVCTATGVKGGRQFATEVYGKDRTTSGDMIRAAETLKGVCMGGAHLPEQAPQSPF
ncbi:MAG TPA: hypothetical protein VMZ53_15290 [Kofleriaceae bacterium]|nr:hypothetical protein [Kofleriaceae bacterium]